MPDIEIIDDGDLSIEKLKDVLDRAFINASIDSDGDIVAEVNDLNTYVQLYEDKKMIKFMMLLGVDKRRTPEEKKDLVNKLNDKVIFARFAIPDHQEDALVADYFLPYEKGVTGFQIVSAIRLFGKVVPNAINLHDDRGMVG